MIIDSAYVAVLDVLGFKELIKNNNEEKMLTIFDLDDIINEFIQIIQKHSEDINRKVEFLSVSDSFFIWTHNDSPRDFFALAHLVKQLLVGGIANGTPLRGAISHGSISITTKEYENTDIKRTNVIGKAIIKAYEYESKQQWSGCMIDPECILKYEEKIKTKEHSDFYSIEELVDDQLLAIYNVPFSQGEIKGYYTINWVSDDVKNALTDEMILNSFGLHGKDINWSVFPKVQNTLNFFRNFKK